MPRELEFLRTPSIRRIFFACSIAVVVLTLGCPGLRKDGDPEEPEPAGDPDDETGGETGAKPET